MRRRFESSGDRPRRPDGQSRPDGSSRPAGARAEGGRPFKKRPRASGQGFSPERAPERRPRSVRRGPNGAEVETEGEDFDGVSADGKERLQKVLAAAGIGSRRDCEELIVQGRVEVDKQVVSELGSKVDPLTQEVRVDGVALPRPKRHYFLVNKPAGVVCTNWDPSGRPRVIDLVPTPDRVFAVGRLDRGSEGLILVTNDGALAHQVTHPRFGVEKTYAVRVEGTPNPEEIAKLKRGIWISEGRCRVRTLIVKKRMRNCSDLLVVLDEGKNREIRRILAKIGHKVLRLRRIAVGSLRLGDLPVGASRRLHPSEIDGLLESARESRRDRIAERKRYIAEKKARAKAEEGAEKKPTEIPALPGKPKRDAKPGAPKPLDLNELMNVRGPYRVTEEDAPDDDDMIEVSSPGAVAPIGDVLDYDEPIPATENEATFDDDGGQGFGRLRGGKKKRPPNRDAAPREDNRPYAGKKSAGKPFPKKRAFRKPDGRPGGAESTGTGERPAFRERPAYGDRPASSDRPAFGDRRPTGAKRPFKKKAGFSKPPAGRGKSSNRPSRSKRKKFD